MTHAPLPAPTPCPKTTHVEALGFLRSPIYQCFLSRLWVLCSSEKSPLLPQGYEGTCPAAGEAGRCAASSRSAASIASQFCLGRSPVPTGRRLCCQRPAAGTPIFSWRPSQGPGRTQISGNEMFGSPVFTAGEVCPGAAWLV